MEVEPTQSTQAQLKDPLTFNMFENHHYEHLLIKSISTELDDFLQGGLHKGTVTQLYGEAGSGKTQVAMMFVLGVRLL